MNIILPSQVEAKLRAENARLDLAIGTYSSGQVTLGTAAEVSGLSISEFQRELGRRRIPVNYGAADLAYDLRAAAELARR